MKKLLLLLLLSLGLIGSSWSDSHQVINAYEGVIIEYPMPTYILIEGVMTLSVCDDSFVDITYEYEDEDDKLIAEELKLDWGGDKSCIPSIDPLAHPDVCYMLSTEFVLKELVSDNPLCIEAEKNND